MKLFKHAIPLILLLIGHAAYSQSSGISFQVKSGASFPVGDYHSKDLSKGCFTTTGLAFSAEVSYSPWEKTGFIAMAGVNYHPVDVGVLGWEKVLADPFLSDLYIRSEGYQVRQYMGGVYYNLPVMKNITLRSQVLLGMVWTKTPYQLYKPEYFMVNMPNYEITSSIDRSPAIQGGTGIEWKIKDYFALGISAEYTYANMQFGFIQQGERRIDERVISFINLNFGFRVFF